MRVQAPAEISIALTPAQVQAVAAAAARASSPALTLLARGLPAVAARAAAAPATDSRLSASLVRGLALLALLGTKPGERGIVELAAELQMSPSTAHRYAQTLLELGLLERSAATRRYRLASCVEPPPARPPS